MPRTPQELLPGSLDMLVLQCLSTDERHGFDVSQWVHDRTRGVLRTPDGALYKALHRLEDRGWVTSRWGRSANRRKAKFYRITAKGRRALEAEREVWSVFSTAVDRALGVEP